MEVKLQDPVEQKLLSRKTYSGTVNFEGGTPSRIDLKNKVAALVSAKPECVIVSDLNTIFGTNTANFTARVYEDEKAMKETELAAKVKKNTPPAPAEEAAEAN